jgi:hypothetical protein
MKKWRDAADSETTLAFDSSDDVGHIDLQQVACQKSPAEANLGQMRDDDIRHCRNQARLQARRVTQIAERKNAFS